MIEYRQITRENVLLLIGLAGGTGSGKTLSALKLARGLAGGEPFAFVDTENGRAKHYADLFPEMRHGEIHAPFRPEKYTEAIQVGAEQFPVVVVDSASHEWAGDGGCLDWHDEIMGTDQSKNVQAWILPKRRHKEMVTKLLQAPAHVILCFRAEPKIEVIREGGKTKIVAAKSLVGLDGWLPISGKDLPYELTVSFLLMADAPGVPKPIKLPENLKPFFPLDRPIDEEAGRRLAEWAAGTTTGAQGPRPSESELTGAEPPADTGASFATEDEVTELLELVARLGDPQYKRACDGIAKQRDQNGGKVPAKYVKEKSKAVLAKVAA